MIESNTVFVLGAGASKPYGFPTGNELLERIENCETLNKMLKLFKGRSTTEHFKLREHYEALRLKIADTAPESIDLLISRWPSLEWIGKLSISTEILEAEKNSLEQFRERNIEHWYTQLFHKITDEVKDKNSLSLLRKNQISIITFNYDRSLEYRLRTLFESLLEIESRDIIFNFVDSIKIIHVHGMIAELFDSQNGKYFRYGDTYTLRDIERLSKNINVMYSSRSNGKSDEISELLSKAEQVFFLGFAYHASNMDYLKFPRKWVNNLSRPANFYGTSMGVPIRKKEGLSEKLTAAIGQFTTTTNKVLFKDCGCAEFVNDYL